MKSFPSTLNEAQNMYGSTKSQSYTTKFDIDRLMRGSLNLTKNVPVIQEMLKERNINISNYQAYPHLMETINPSNAISDTRSNVDINAFYENPLQLPAEIIALAKDYDWVYKNRVKSILSIGEKSGDSIQVKIGETAVAPSMFNPMYGINILGFTRNTPLLNDIKDDDVYKIYKDTSDCSIRTLCALSKNSNNPLGQARYKYADFMYCKDLGKVSNNHLITLRKFAHPVGDHIGELATPQYVSSGGDYTFKIEGDVGRLVTWFGTDDNKLEDICKYSYHATWKELGSEIQEKDSTADDETTGILGMISNSFNPLYNKAVSSGIGGSHSLWGYLATTVTGKSLQGINKNNELLRNYDNNKVYTPMNTIQSTHIYEGKLEFSQEFTLNFSYELRAYDNINPRAALTDLLGNILEVTYRRGKFWGGDRKIIGPQQDMSAFETVNNFIDNSFEKLGGYFSSLFNGNYKMNDILGKMGSMIPTLYNNLLNKNNQFNFKEAAGKLVDATKAMFSNSGIAEAAKGYIKNALGRPTMYAWNSILSGDAVGLWHVMVGNPRNPILSIGNLILTNATVSHSGPLGIDDFPTELKVSITLKHARPRDVTEIGRMYTQGASAIYQSFAHHNLKDFFGGTGGGSKDDLDETAANAAEAERTKGQPKSQITPTGSDAKSEAAKNSYDYNASYMKEVNNIGESDQFTLNTNGINNPFLTSDMEVKIARTNNYSDTMFSVSMQEAA